MENLILMFFLIFGAALVLKTVRGYLRCRDNFVILCVYRFLSLYLMCFIALTLCEARKQGKRMGAGITALK